MARGTNRVQLLGSAGYVSGQEHTMWDFLYVTSTTRNPLYNIGDRVVTPDGRTFRYSLATNTVYAGQGNAFGGTISSDGIATTCAAAQAVGDISLTFATQTFTADELRGGYIVIYGASNDYAQQRGIIGNTAATATTVTVYLDGPLTAAVTTSTYCEVLPNPYRYITGSNFSDYASVAGVAAVRATVGQYFWLQTWGVCWIAPGEAGMGGIQYERQLIFDGSTGALRPFNKDVTKCYQFAGFIMDKTSAGNDGCPFIMLQISP